MKRTVKILSAVLAVPLVLFLVLLLALFIWYFAATSKEHLQPEKLSLSDACVVLYDGAGNKADARSGNERAASSELPDHLKHAFVAVEDKRFYDHHGLDYRRMVKAALKNLASFSFREGASTISQQLVKNTHLSGEKTVTRKFKEIKLARALEKTYSKDEILELYLNSIYFGHSAFGVSSAARFYFGKTPSELSPCESAMLAALVRSPNRYSPFRDPAKCLARRNFVLSLMAEQGYLSAGEAEAAKREPLPGAPAETPSKSAYFTQVYDELYDLFPDASSGDVLRVYTYLDPALQAELDKTETDCDHTVLVRDLSTHGVKAFSSTCGLLDRLPASTIKPLAVYAPALEENLVSPATPVLDEKTDFGGYSPSDYGGTYGGYMSVRYALANSVNVPAVKLLNALGVRRAAEYLEKLGLPVPQEDQTLALALGGMSKGYPLTSLADAYAALACGGSYSPSSFIARVENGEGKVLYSFSPERKRVFSDDVAFLVNDMLRTAAKEGTAKRLKGLPYEVCAKTGTGGTDKGNTDAYTVAYTTKDVVAVWLGQRDNAPIDATGGGIPANIALGVLGALYQDGAPADFPACDKVTRAALDREEYETRHRMILADPIAPKPLALYELFRNSALPTVVSDKFSHPTIDPPQISVTNGSVRIVLCQTEYYDYIVNRECEGQTCTVYRGKYRKELFDNSVSGGKRYVYTVIPLYRDVAGEPVTLPSVYIKKSSEIPDDWWLD